jgi:hypothetical protein
MTQDSPQPSGQAKPEIAAAKASAYDINEGASGFRLPSLPDQLSATSIEGYANAFERLIDNSDSPLVGAAKALGITPPKYEVAKGGSSLGTVPSAFSYGSMSYMPDNATNGGVIQWPGIAPDALRKVVRENVAPQLIIGMRVDDIMRYSDLSTHLWKPGWRIDARDADAKPTDSHKKNVQEAQEFLLNSAMDLGVTKARDRDQNFLRGFRGFLAASVRDSLTFDAIAVWTNMSNDGKVKAYASLPAGNIRLATRAGYEGNAKKFAVAVDDGGRVIQAFTRDELTFYVRNPRNDSDTFGYGYSECEIALRLISGFQNALDLNCGIFDKSAIAAGILTISGNSVTQRQLDLVNRLLTNMKKGITKAWALPVMGLSDGAKLELLDLSKMKGNEAYYKEFMNMLAGALCTIYRFPVRRLGYRISGGSHDARPMPDATAPAIDENDPGLAPLLGHIETLINEYLIWSRWPTLQFCFCGKSPAEDAREYEARSLAKTYAEKRKEAGLDPLEKEAPSDLKWFAELMGLAPSDPSLAGIFQTVASVIVKAKVGDGKASEDAATPGNRMESKNDPAVSLGHGHEAGVRRDSAAEASSAGKDK